MRFHLVALAAFAASTVCAQPGSLPQAGAAQWGPYHAEFPAASDSLIKKIGQADIFGDARQFSLSGWFKPSETISGDSLLAGAYRDDVTHGWFLCALDGKLAFCGETHELRTSAPLQPGRWTHLAASFDGTMLTMYADGQEVAHSKLALLTTLSRSQARIALAPRGRVAGPFLGAYAGRIASFAVGGKPLDAASVRALAARVPAENLINFETGSPSWPIQVRQMYGQVAPQDPWTLPTSSAPFSQPVATPAYKGPALLQTAPDRWTVKAWRLQAAPLVKATPEQISAPTFDASGWYPATTPGTVLTTLVDRGVYPDPDYGLNNMAIPESLNRQDYWYRAPFLLPASYKPGRHLFVTFKGVNYLGEVWINGHRLGTIKGAFVRGTFDLGPHLSTRGENVLAVKVSPPPHPGLPHEESQRAGSGENGGTMAQDGPTFIASEGWDWIPSVRDRNTGLWQDVLLRATGDVTLGDPHIVTALPVADNSVADIDVDVPVTNLAGSARRVTVRATIARRDDSMKPIIVSQTLTLASGTHTVRFTPAQFAALRLQNPQLWWPNGYGAPDLHVLDLDVVQEGVVSDHAQTRFGVRSVTYELSLVDRAGHLRRVEADFTKGHALGVRITDGSHGAIKKLADEQWATGLRAEADGTAAVRDLPATTLTPYLVIKVNGVRIAARGGNWGTDDWRKRIDRDRLEPYFRLHRDAHVNVIRNWVGQNTEDAFYDLADEYGLMVLNDFWASTQDYNLEPQDVGLFMQNATDVVKRYRNHPSIIAWFGRNEGVPQPILNEALEAMIYQEDGTRWYTGSSNRINLQNSGPYSYQEPVRYFTEHARGFSVEVGTPSFPTIESLKAAIPASEQWPLSDSITYHDWHADGNGSVKSFIAAMDKEYGSANSLEDFERKAQLLNYESHRAIFEGMNAGLWREHSGRLLWMTQPAWPSTMWQILSHDYDTHAAFYGVKSAAEPVHVQMNLPDYRLMVINNPAMPLAGAVVSYVAYDTRGNRVAAGERPVSVDAVSTSSAVDVGLAQLINTSKLLIVQLSLRDGNGRELSRNTYWPSANPADQQALARIASVPLEVVTSWVASPTARPGERHLQVVMRNPGAVPALANKLTLLNSDGERILPVYYSDNYVSLMPGESRTVTLDFKGPSLVKLDLRGWNAQHQSVAVAP